MRTSKFYIVSVNGEDSDAAYNAKGPYVSQEEAERVAAELADRFKAEKVRFVVTLALTATYPVTTINKELL